MSNCFEILELKFSGLDTKIANKINFVEMFHDVQQRSINEHYEIKTLTKKHSNEFNNLRESLLQVISTHLRLEIEHVDELVRTNGKNAKFKIHLNKLKKTRGLNFNRSIIKSETACIMRLIAKEFKFGSKFSAAQLIKYKHVLGISQYLFLNDNVNDWDRSLIKAFGNRKLKFEIFRLLVDGGANINAKDNSNYHNSTISELVKYYIKKSKNVGSSKQNENTALILASEKGHFEIVKYLVENGGDLNASGEFDETALILASLRGHLEIVKYLVENGANINAINKRNNTALALASRYERYEIAKYLVEHGAGINSKS